MHRNLRVSLLLTIVGLVSCTSTVSPDPILGITSTRAPTPESTSGTFPVVVTRCILDSDRSDIGCAIWIGSIHRTLAGPSLILDKVLFEAAWADHFSPQLAPDGTKVLFHVVSAENKKPDIFVVRTDGTDPRNLIQNPNSDIIISWCPDSKRFVFQSYQDGQSKIYVAEVDSGSTRQILNGCPGWGTDWLPEGNRISAQARIYDTNRDGQIDSDDSSEIYTTSLEECNPQRLTYNDHDELFSHWSPDGRYVAFVVPRQEGVFTLSTQIYVLDTQTGEERLLFEQRPAGHWQIEGLSWGPMGQNLLFVMSNVKPLGDKKDQEYNLYLISTEGGEAEQVLAPEGLYTEADW